MGKFMSPSELISKILELIDQFDQTEQPKTVELTKVDSDLPGEKEDLDIEVSDIMVPPLQQKLELLKKTAGVDSTFDGEQDEDELADIKRLSGIGTIVQVAAEDNDITE